MISFIGGTGPEGRGLALRFAIIGQQVFLGSRDPQRGVAAASDVRALLPQNYPHTSVMGGANEQAARMGDIVFIAVPYSAQKDTLTELEPQLRGKVIVNVVAPLAFVKGSAQALPVEAGSAAEEARDLLPESSVVGAFHNLSAIDLLMPMQGLDCDVVVCGDDPDAKAKVMALAESIKGVRAVNGGALVNSRYVEHLTSLLININRIYKAHSSIRITGIDSPPAQLPWV